MKRWRNITRLVLVVCGFVLFACETGQADGCGSILARTMQAFYDFRIRLSAFNDIREYRDYIRLFGGELVEDFSALGPDDHIIEMGSGETRFAEGLFTLRDLNEDDYTFRGCELPSADGSASGWLNGSLYLTPEAKRMMSPGLYVSPRIITLANRFFARPLLEKPRYTAITYRLKRKVSDFDGRLQVIRGRFFQELDLDESDKAKLIIDVFGVASYYAYLGEVLQRYLDLLEVGGSIFLFPPNGLVKWITTLSGEKLSLLEWLQRVESIEIKQLSVMVLGAEEQLGLKITKQKDGVVLPKIEPAVRWDFAFTPNRVFREVRTSNEEPSSLEFRGPIVVSGFPLGLVTGQRAQRSHPAPLLLGDSPSPAVVPMEPVSRNP